VLSSPLPPHLEGSSWAETRRSDSFDSAAHDYGQQQQFPRPVRAARPSCIHRCRPDLTVAKLACLEQVQRDDHVYDAISSPNRA